jgi:hypothetical protein
MGMSEATQYRMTLTLQPLTAAGEPVGPTIMQAQTLAIATRATFDPSRRIIAMRARDLGDQAAAEFYGALEPLVTR